VKKLKRCNFERPGKLEREALYEVAVLQYLQTTDPASASKNILRLIGAWELIDVDGNLTCCIVTEWAPGGDIMDAVIDLGQAKTHFSERTAAKFLRQVVGGLHATHSVGVLHRDIKPDNLLLSSKVTGKKDDDARVILCDFGLAKCAGTRMKGFGT